MAKTGIVIDRRFQEHLTGADHPEKPERLVRITDVLTERGLVDACISIAATPVDVNLVRLNHDDTYLTRLQQACEANRPFIDIPDSRICPDSWTIAQLAAGAAINAVDEVLAGRVDNAFCAVRPPGHHAERNVSMGFCLLNNIAIAARHLLEDHGLSRVLILDWDVHHGNGTQHSFEEDSCVMYISLHGHPGVVYPGTGFVDERGRGAGEGFTLNVPILPPGRDDVWRRAFDESILPAVARFDPQFVLISAGFDAHRDDPLAPLELETESYGWMTDEVVRIARDHCDGKLVSLLEGGYDLNALADSVALHVTRLLDA